MFPLIEIQTVPISIEMKVTDAKLEYVNGTADLEISRSDGGLSIKSRPIRLNVDTFEARNTVRPSVATSVRDSAQKGQQAAYAATASYVQKGNLLLEAQVSQEQIISHFAAESYPVGPTPDVEYTPLPEAAIQWTPGDMQISYEMDKLNFDWRMGDFQLEFTPGDIEITIEQMPDVIIKYVGGPLYVPPSSDPSYRAMDVQA